MKMKFAAAIALIGLVLSGCSKEVSLQSLLGGDGPVIPTSGSASPSPTPAAEYPCPADQTRSWKFTQPTAGSRKMDLLLVVDTSGSIWNEQQKIAKQISSYMAGLPQGADLQIAVLPAHGPWSSHYGRLHAAEGQPLVIQTKNLTSAEIQKEVYKNLSCLPFDLTPGGGEYGFRALMRATHKKGIASLKKVGFLREDAHLTVLFVSDENDICYCPKAHGFSSFPDYVPSLLGQEELGYAMYCMNKKEKEKFSPEHIQKHLSHLKGAQNFTVGSIAHVLKSGVRQRVLSEDSIGHGYLELVSLNAPRGRSIEITSTSYADGLRELANVGSQSEIFTRFELGSLTPIEDSSLFVTVDGFEVGFDREISSEDHVAVILNPLQAGRAGSEVWIRACSKFPDR